MEDLISVIIPVYNSARYIKECINSILEQSYTVFEVILIDDGSADDSVEICRELSRADHRIRLLRQEHQGVSAARNYGIREANGKYLFFIDSDDMIHPQLLNSLYVLLESKNAVMATGYYCLEDDGWKEQLDHKFYFDADDVCTYLSNQELMEEYVYERYGGLSGIGGKMILREAVKYLCFDENMTNGEDTKYIYQLVEQGADAVFLHMRWYYYRKHEGGASKKLTETAFRGRYECACYIRDQGEKNGRIIQAEHWEGYIARRIVEWYRLGRQTHDGDLIRYTKGLALSESSSGIFAKIDQRTQKDFFLAFHCYPLLCMRQQIRKSLNKKKNIQKPGRWNGASEKFEGKIRRNLGRISVIISVHNSERFIRQCICSVLRQTYMDLEIIVIDDGSTDRSLEVCREMGESDKRIRLFSQKRKGSAAAWNYGMNVAAGKYIFFMEGDDAIHPLLLEVLVRQAAGNLAEITLCEYTRLYGQWFEKILNLTSEVDERPKWQIVDQEASSGWFHTKYKGERICAGALILRKFIGDLRFDDNLPYGADSMFMHLLICRQVKMIYSPQEWYYYRMTPDRISFLRRKIDEEHYCTYYKGLRDSEMQMGNKELALFWERRLIWKYRQKYSSLKVEKDAKGCLNLQERAAAEREHVLFRKLALPTRVLFQCCFSCYPLYYLLEQPMKKLDKIIWARRR